MKSPANNLIVKLKQKYYDSITFDSGVKLHVDPMWQPQEWAMLTAEVISVPDYIINRADYRNLKCEVKPGDTILIRYDMVFSYVHQPDRDTPIYKNMILHYDESTQRHEEYWLCDIQKVFAIVKGDEYIMQNDYVMVKGIPRYNHFLAGRLWTPDLVKSTLYEDRAKVISIGAQQCAQNIANGDEIRFIPNVAQQYRIDQNTFWIIRQRHILAKNTA